MRIYQGVDISIPGRLNILIAVCAYGSAAALLWLASHSDSILGLILAAVGFSYVNNTIFSLLHESVHGIFHENKTINNTFGRLSAAFFPTGFTFQRYCHLGHHRRNRTDDELFDYYTAGDNRFIKYYRLYSLLTGFYWLSIPIGCLLFLFARGWFVTSWFQKRIAGPMGLAPMVADLQNAPVLPACLEILLTVFLQLLLIYALQLKVSGWLSCYVAFALNWCSLQYTDHAWTVRDIKNGAWNLKVNHLVQSIFLNYHHHLAHHQHPRVPWIHLHKFIDFSQPRPSFLRIYLSLWRGPRLTTEPAPQQITPELSRELTA